MAQRNLLDLVQTILEALGESQVDSIEETGPSLQVANIIRDVYYEGLANRNWAHKSYVTSLAPLGVSTPTHLLIDTEIKEIERINYNMRKASDTKDKYGEVEYKDPVDFLDYINSRNSSDATVTSVTDVNGATLLIRNDVAPTFWTSFDDTYAVFDSYDSGVDATIQASKQQVHAVKSTAFTLEDSFIPDIPEEAMPWLLAEAKSVAFMDIAQEGNQKAEQQSRRQQQWLSRNNRRAGKGYSLAQFGRTPRK
jgi:hypothetical protein